MDQDQRINMLDHYLNQAGPNKKWPNAKQQNIQWIIYKEMESAVFRVVTSWRLESSRRFGGTYRVHLSKSKQSKELAGTGTKLSLQYVPADNGNIFLRNVRCSPSYTALQHWRPYSSQSSPWVAYYIKIQLLSELMYDHNINFQIINKILYPGNATSVT
jgi:hypothetical protein